MLKESVYREKQFMYSVFHSSNKEEEEAKAERKEIKRLQKQVIASDLIEQKLGDLGKTADG